MVVNIVLDIGNTRCKAGVFIGDDLEEKKLFDLGDLESLTTLVLKYKPVFSIISSVSVEANMYKRFLEKHTSCIEMTPALPIPFRNSYATPETLGMDRVAAISGAQQLFPGRACLVIDLGTCITYDFITDTHEYLGGAISPGLRMRLKAMAHFTKRLPDLNFEVPETLIGNSTRNSMLSGVYYGLWGEINEMIGRYEEQFGDLQVILCGGDSGLFDKHTKKSIFAAPDLVLYGLNQLLRYNVK